jgi:hypothetical protein
MKKKVTLFTIGILFLNISCSKVFYDKFPGNTDDWKVYSEESGKVEIKNGLNISQVSDELNTYATKDFSKFKDAIIEVVCSVKKFEGATGVGIIWNFKDEETHNRFIITTRDQQFFIQYKADGERKEIKAWTLNEAIIKDDGTNILKLKQNGSSLEFYANNALLHTQENSKLSLNRIGVMMGSQPGSRCVYNLR